MPQTSHHTRTPRSWLRVALAAWCLLILQGIGWTVAWTLGRNHLHLVPAAVAFTAAALYTQRCREALAQLRRPEHNDDAS